MTSFIEIEIIAIAAMAALVCAVPGSIIALRKNPYMADTAARSSVLGLAVGFASAGGLPPAVLIPFGTAAAILGIWLVNRIREEKIMSGGSASVAVSSVLLSAGVLIINNFTDFSHADINTVMAGELAFIPFDRITAWGYDIGPAAIYALGAALLFNLLCVVIFYKEIKLSAIDESYARASQMGVDRVYMLVSFMAALTAASAFRVTGAFMTTAFLLAPSLTARFYTKRLSAMIATSVIICITACLTGFGIAYRANVLISGTIVCIMGAFFIISAVAAPETGIIRVISDRRNKRFRTGMEIAAVHIFLHEKDGRAEEKNKAAAIRSSMAWSGRFTEKVFRALEENGLIYEEKGLIKLTEEGRKKAETAIGVKNAA